MDLQHIIIAPVITEKSFAGQQLGKYVFRVHKNATKVDIKNAIQKLYGIKPVSVNMTLVIPKKRTVGRHEIQKRNAYKKAIVRIPKGSTLDFTKLTTP